MWKYHCRSPSGLKAGKYFQRDTSFFESSIHVAIRAGPGVTNATERAGWEGQKKKHVNTTMIINLPATHVCDIL